MRLLSLRARDFRNLEQVELVPSPRATIIVGENGQGKTNLLEALYFLATLRPLRAGKLSELLRFGAEAAWVEGRFALGGAERDISVEIREKSRKPCVDGKRAQSLEAYFGGVSVVAFTPDDLRVIKGGPDGRRAFFDRSVFNRYPAYLAESRTYARALKARNRLLKDKAAPGYLEAYDEALAQAGARLWVRRRAVLAELGTRVTGAFADIGRLEVQARLRYLPAHWEQVPGNPDFAPPHTTELRLAQALHQLLVARRGRDLERGFTSVGPHADDLDLKLGEHPARAFASQGQQRALVLAWKVAEIENLQETLGFLPLLLLDDVSSELDPERNAYLMRYLAKSGAQVFLTTTDEGLVQRAALEDSVWYEVRSGRFVPRPAQGA